MSLIAGSIDRETPENWYFSLSWNLTSIADLQSLEEGRLVSNSLFPKAQIGLGWFLFFKKLLTKLKSYPNNQLSFFFEIIPKKGGYINVLAKESLDISALLLVRPRDGSLRRKTC